MYKNGVWKFSQHMPISCIAKIFRWSKRYVIRNFHFVTFLSQSICIKIRVQRFSIILRTFFKPNAIFLIFVNTDHNDHVIMLIDLCYIPLNTLK